MKLKLTELTEKITALPLKASPCVSGSHMGIIIASNKELVASVADQETAAYIAHACNQLPALISALEKIYGFGRSRGVADMTFDELAGLVNETCEEALTLAREVEI